MRLLCTVAQLSYTKKFIVEIQSDDTMISKIGDAEFLTTPLSCGISRAHAGLAELRPPLPKPSKSLTERYEMPPSGGARRSRRSGSGEGPWETIPLIQTE